MNRLTNSRDVPVAIHMWFEDGDDWAFHPFFTGKLRDVAVALDEVFRKSDTQDFVVRFGDGFLAGERIPDVNCRDPRAAQRRPFIVRAALLEDRPTSDELEDVRKRLRALLPRDAGASESLKISFEELLALVEEVPERQMPGHSSAAPPIIYASNTRLQECLDERIDLQEEVRRLMGEKDAWTGRYANCARSLTYARRALLFALLFGITGLLMVAAIMVFERGNESLLLMGAAVMTAVIITSSFGLFLSRTKKKSLQQEQSTMWESKC